MTDIRTDAHQRSILGQFTRQAEGFAMSRALHGDDVVRLVVEAAAPRASDRALDIACGTGSVACAMAAHVAEAVGLDATPAMLDEARKLAAKRALSNVQWREGSAYAAPFGDTSFDIVSCRFAFHHLEEPARAFREMIRLAAPGGRIVLCDGIVSDDPVRARAFNAMERFRDPSTIEFRSLDYLHSLFAEAGLGEPVVQRFHVEYRARDLARGSFPEGGDREGLLNVLEGSVEGDRLGMNARRDGETVYLSYPSVVLSAVRS